MRTAIDPRGGDFEDDASSTKSRSMWSLAGSLLGEISLPKLVTAWVLLLVVPALTIGLAPIVFSIGTAKLWGKLTAPLGGVWALLLLAAALVLGWVAGRALWRMAHDSFWSLSSVTIEPGYATCREAIRHLAESLVPSLTRTQLGRLRAAAAIAAGLVVSAVAVLAIRVAWPSSRWVLGISDLGSPRRLAAIALANCIVLIAGYLAAMSLVWAFADAAMAQPRDAGNLPAAGSEERAWRIVHLSDIHVVGERYGFRIESGRAGPRGNERLMRVLDQLESICAEEQPDAILVTGDITDAGRSTEWAEFLDAITCHPRLAGRMLILPGNHDLNIVDRANPARLDLPNSPNQRLRQMRALSAMEAVQGHRTRVVDRVHRCLGPTLSEVMDPYRDAMAAFAGANAAGVSGRLKKLWDEVFPLVVPPEPDDGLGMLLLDSNAATHFSFTNALGMVPADQMRGIDLTTAQYPRARWIIALHHHLVEYPRPAKALSERIGTALINGSWVVRRLRPLAGKAVVMHGHRHIDWVGECAGIAILSAPSPVMDAAGDEATYFYLHTLAAAEAGCIRLQAPRRVVVEGEPVTV